jgi:hypothetical protein
MRKGETTPGHEMRRKEGGDERSDDSLSSQVLVERSIDNNRIPRVPGTGSQMVTDSISWKEKLKGG